MKHVEVVTDEDVAVVKLSRKTTNAIDLELIHELFNYLKAAKNDTEISGLVLTSANEKFFSIGFDIPGLINLEEKDFSEFYHAFNQLCIEMYTFPKPVVAAITGHAVAGGCILTICCDYRFISEGKKLMGLNEIKLGVPLPYPADCILRQIVDDRSVRKILDTGDFFPPAETLKMGLVDEVMPLQQVLPTSMGKIKSIVSFSLEAFRMIKQNRTEKVAAQIQAELT
ncbi:MAG: enoyl-CoA hydratase/isomerase family protein, partial [candidate division WOR-3 bacterium]|nr:enoyl-CoA hydratase/isomerase family protein [candidate division WOR-3 bacterium]